MIVTGAKIVTGTSAAGSPGRMTLTTGGYAGQGAQDAVPSPPGCLPTRKEGSW